MRLQDWPNPGKRCHQRPERPPIQHWCIASLSNVTVPAKLKGSICYVPDTIHNGPTQRHPQYLCKRLSPRLHPRLHLTGAMANTTVEGNKNTVSYRLEHNSPLLCHMQTMYVEGFPQASDPLLFWTTGFLDGNGLTAKSSTSFAESISTTLEDSAFLKPPRVLYDASTLTVNDSG